MTEKSQPPENPWDKVIGRIHAKRLPAESMFRNVVGYADLAGAGVMFMFPKGAPPNTFLPTVSDETTTNQLLLVREWLTNEIGKRMGFTKTFPNPPKRNA